MHLTVLERQLYAVQEIPETEKKVNKSNEFHRFDHS
jgi:hypothetical protein